MESFAFHDKITSIKSNGILQKCSKLYIISLESLEEIRLCFGQFLKGEGMNKKRRTLCYSNLVRLQKFQKVFKVYALSFWCKMWT